MFHFELSQAGIKARVRTNKIVFAHMGCKLLGTLRPHAPKPLQEKWAREMGSAWHKTTDSVGKLASMLHLAAKQEGLNGVDLYDTMRTGSDYWRPGNLLSKCAEHLYRERLAVSYLREDDLCPPLPLLKQAMSGSISFAQYAAGYAGWLRENRFERLAVARDAVLMGLARERLVVFYCVDPYVPGCYPRLLTPQAPYQEREWFQMAPDCETGCHRVVLAEELGMYFRKELGVKVEILELEQTRGVVHRRAA